MGVSVGDCHCYAPLPGLHPAHALQGPHAASQAAPGAERQRALALHPLLPCLERLPQAPRLSKGWGHPELRSQPPWHCQTPQHSALPHTPAPNKARLGAASPQAGASREHWGCPSVPPAQPLPKGGGKQMGEHGSPLPPAWGRRCPQTSAKLPLQLGDRSISQFGWEDALLKSSGCGG